MGAAESVPRQQSSRRVVDYRTEESREVALNEKFDSFKITEDRETDSMLVERTRNSEGVYRLVGLWSILADILTHDQVPAILMSRQRRQING